MEINILFSLCLITLTSGAVNYPKVHEDQIEYNRNDEYIRHARNPQSTYKPRVHQPQVFNFGTAKQQDYLKHKYIEQQMIDMARIAAMRSKNRNFYVRQPTITSSNYQQPSRSHRAKKDTQGWQPINPQIPKHNIAEAPEVQHSSTNNIASNNISNIATQNDRPTSEITNKRDTIKRHDSPGMLNSVIYVHPNMFIHNLDKNAKETHQVLDVNAKNSETQLNVLNELIGKNPNVQLEGLQRLLQQPSNNNHIPAIKGPEPFQLQDHTPVNEKLVDIPNLQDKPNIHVQNMLPSVPIPKLPSVINRESLNDLQKQFDEASKLQIEQVLARAQQDAQAQVEAQHKAIALAQAEAQRNALENFEKTFYSLARPTAAPLIQENDQNQVKPQASDVAPVAVNQPVTPSSYPVQIQKQPLAKQELQDITNLPQLSNYKEFVKLPNNPQISSQDGAVSESYNAKQLLYYAPNHQHHDVAQLQDDRGYPLQPQAQNVAILEDSFNHQQSVESDEEINDKHDVIVIHTTSRPELINDAFQQALDPEETRRIKKLYVSGEDTNYDDPDELQYAAKYAFGYRIKDAQEGNDFGHEERRNGKSAEGSYHVLLPDGRLQKVQYYADKTGYHAKVTYEHVSHK